MRYYTITEQFPMTSTGEPVPEEEIEDFLTRTVLKVAKEYYRWSGQSTNKVQNDSELKFNLKFKIICSDRIAHQVFLHHHCPKQHSGTQTL